MYFLLKEILEGYKAVQEGKIKSNLFQRIILFENEKSQVDRIENQTCSFLCKWTGSCCW